MRNKSKLEIARKGGNVISIKAELSATITREKPGIYVAHCEALDVCSQGDTAH